MTLQEYIEIEHKGNVAAFAKVIGTHRNQVDRWLVMDCIWYKGNVWQKKTKLEQVQEINSGFGADPG